MKNKKTLKKGAYFTDIHFGKKANSETHNQDCLNFISWFCEQVEADPEIDYIAFLGDWNENRSALNIQTLNYSYRGAKRLDELGLPIFFVVGNHDLYHRHTREVHSVIPFNEFKNFILIEEPMIVEMIEGRALFAPYLFHDEYPNLKKHLDIPWWAGHFEFRGYEVTGYGMLMPTGPDPSEYQGPNYIVSGHFHKRQARPESNVVYIGNAFPMDFGDAGDTSRGMMTYDHVKDEMLFNDWAECPKYIKTTLTDILDGTATLHPDARVKCIVDVPISFEESTALRQSFADKFKLREFTLEESSDIREALSGTEMKIDWDDTKLAGVDELVEQMLREISSDHINNQKLIEIYKELKP